jgi:hypothetical protein
MKRDLRGVVMHVEFMDYKARHWNRTQRGVGKKANQDKFGVRI